MQADLVSGDWKTKAYWIGSRKREFRDIAEYIEILQYVENKAAIESGTMVGRTYAKPIRRR